MGSQGLDYVCVDLQHGLASIDRLVPMLQAIELGGSTPLVRVPSTDGTAIMSVLDRGAHGVIVPMVDDAQMAADAAAACKYPPAGIRSYGPTRSGLTRRSIAMERLQDVACIVMVETAAGLDQAAAIAATPGVDAVYVGPADLALALGLAPGESDARFDAALEHVLETCHSAGKVAGIHCPDGTTAKRRLDQGFTMVTLVGDVLALRRGVEAEINDLRSQTP